MLTKEQIDQLMIESVERGELVMMPDITHWMPLPEPPSCGRHLESEVGEDGA